ncbi:MAG: Gfo/Idh/MocA family protein [Planctomycetaceae bacterium]
MKFGVGVVGATGYIGTPYRKEIRESPAQARIVALCARRRDLLMQAAEQDQAVLATDDWREVVDHPDVNLILVTTPDALHYEPVLACARLRKHLFCEKPIAANIAEAREMWQAINDAGVGHYVPFWTRYVPVCRRARELVQAGTLGEIKGVIYRWHNPRPFGMPFTWRDDAALSSAGSLADVGSHAYDTMRWLIDDEADRVLCHADVITPAKPDLGTINLEEALNAGKSAAPSAASPMKKGTAYDFADVAIQFQSGAVGSLVLSHAPFFRKGLAPEIELHGTSASLAVDRTKSTITLARQGEEPILLETVADPGIGNRFSKYVFPALEERIAGRPTEHPGLDDGYRVQLFTDAAALSAREGRWVSLRELDG